jgi:hypothetical protein
MKKIKVLIMLLFIAFICTGCPDKCEDCHQYITVENKSGIKINVQMIWRGNISQADTLWDCRVAALPIEINSSRQFECARFHRGGNWENDFKVIPYIQFLIFDAEVYEETVDYEVPCEETTYTIPVLYRYQLTLEDLQRMNWTVVYPPNGK